MEILMPQDKIIEEIKINSVLRDRKVFINEEVDRDSMFKAVYFLDRIVALDNKSNIPISERDNIEIFIDSHGGSIEQGLMLISKVEELMDKGYKIITTTQAVGYSMGFMFAIIASERRMYRYGILLAHQPSCWLGGTLQDIEDEVVELKRLWDLMKKLILKYTKIPESKLDEVKKGKKDWILTAEQALELGCIDYIL
jgi:ATP-dependent Clp protease protease subunit